MPSTKKVAAMSEVATGRLMNGAEMLTTVDALDLPLPVSAHGPGAGQAHRRILPALNDSGPAAAQPCRIRCNRAADTLARSGVEPAIEIIEGIHWV